MVTQSFWHSRSSVWKKKGISVYIERNLVLRLQNKPFPPGRKPPHLQTRTKHTDMPPYLNSTTIHTEYATVTHRQPGIQETYWPGTRVEPELPIRGHYCQTLERKLPAVHWLPTYLPLQFNYKLDNMMHCTHSLWQCSASDVRKRGQLAERFTENADACFPLTSPTRGGIFGFFYFPLTEFIWLMWQATHWVLKLFLLLFSCYHEKLDLGQIWHYSSDRSIKKWIKAIIKTINSQCRIQSTLTALQRFAYKSFQSIHHIEVNNAKWKNISFL